MTTLDTAPAAPPDDAQPSPGGRTERPRGLLRMRGRGRLKVAVLYALGLAGGLGVWWLLHVREGSARVASPLETWDALVELHRRGDLWTAIRTSGERIIKGWGLGLLVGVPVGIAMGQWRTLRSLFDPYLQFLRFIPPIALIPLLIALFGIGETPKLLLIFYTCVFIVTINTIAGVQAVDESRIRAATSLGAGPARRLLSVVVPSTVPFIFTAARLAMGNAFLTIVAAEFVAAEEGVGAMLWRARNYGRTDWVFAGIFLLGMMGLITDLVLRAVGRSALRRFSVAT